MTMNKKVGCVFNLPEDIIVSSILPCLPMHEVARTSIVSHAWNHYWHHIPLLHFDKPITNQFSKISSTSSSYSHLLAQKRYDFVNWVDGILDKHVGRFIDEFKLIFYLDNNHHDHINKWFVWALSRNVKRLHLDLTSARFIHVHNFCVLDKPIDVKVRPVLTSLCLKSVNVSNEFVEYLVESCGYTLEKLLIEKSDNLTCIKGSNECVSLKYFKVSNCPDLVTIDIQAPNLESFVYETGLGLGSGLDLLRIENASSLSHVLIQGTKEEPFLFALQSLSNYFPHIQYLKLLWCLDCTIDRALDNYPVLANLKHLELFPLLCPSRSMVGWIPFIKACPLLEKLTVRLRPGLWIVPSENVDNHPLLKLKTLELMNFNGCNIDADITNFIFKNGVALQEVILRTSNVLHLKAPLANLVIDLPIGVKLVLD